MHGYPMLEMFRILSQLQILTISAGVGATNFVPLCIFCMTSWSQFFVKQSFLSCFCRLIAASSFSIPIPVQQCFQQQRCVQVSFALQCEATQLIISSTPGLCTEHSRHFQLFVLPDEVRVLAVNMNFSGLGHTKGCAAMLGGFARANGLIAPPSRCSRLAAPMQTRRPTRVSVDPVQCIWDGSKRFKYKDYTGRIYREVRFYHACAPALAS